MHKRLIIFDFDGVLVDTVGIFEREVRATLSDLGYGFVRDRDAFYELFEENIAVALIENGVTPAHMCTVWERLQAAMAREEIRFCQGVPEMLAALGPRFTMAIVSNNSAAIISSALTRLGVIGHFTSISGGDEDFEKAERIRACYAFVGMEPGFTYYVGDTVGDVRDAHAAGVKAVSVSWGGYPSRKLAEASPDHAIASPRELVALLTAPAP